MFSDPRPEVAGVIFSGALSCCAERLAGITASDELNAISKAVHWQGFKIRPDRRRNHPPLFHLRNQVGSGVGFDLDMSDDSMLKSGELKSSFDATVSCA